jgi:hypothetical protein
LLCVFFLSLSVFIRCKLVLNFTSEAELYLLLICVFSLGENEEKANTIQPPFLCFSHLHTICHIGKTQVPHQIDKKHDKILYRGGNPHLTRRFCDDELGPEFQNGIRACRIQGSPTYSRTKPKECWA